MIRPAQVTVLITLLLWKKKNYHDQKQSMEERFYFPLSFRRFKSPWWHGVMTASIGNGRSRKLRAHNFTAQGRERECLCALKTNPPIDKLPLASEAEPPPPKSATNCKPRAQVPVSMGDTLHWDHHSYQKEDSSSVVREDPRGTWISVSFFSSPLSANVSIW